MHRRVAANPDVHPRVAPPASSERNNALRRIYQSPMDHAYRSLDSMDDAKGHPAPKSGGVTC